MNINKNKKENENNINKEEDKKDIKEDNIINGKDDDKDKDENIINNKKEDRKIIKKENIKINDKDDDKNKIEGFEIIDKVEDKKENNVINENNIKDKKNEENQKEKNNINEDINIEEEDEKKDSDDEYNLIINKDKKQENIINNKEDINLEKKENNQKEKENDKDNENENDDKKENNDKKGIKKDNYEGHLHFGEQPDENNIENGIHYTEVIKYGDNKPITIYHLILANEDSDEVKLFNKYAYKYIENLYNTIPNPQKFDVIEEIKNEFIDIAPKILKNINKEKLVFNSNEEILKNKIIKLNLEEEEGLDLNNLNDIEDEFSLKENVFKPKYSYFTKNENILEIRLEIPGNCKCNAKSIVEKDMTKIIVSGVKKKDKEPEKLEDYIGNIRLFTDFETIISLPVEKYQIASDKPKEGYPKFINGICIIQYDLISQSVEQSTEVDGV